MSGATDCPGGRLERAAIAAAALLLAGCATVPPDAGKNPRDPFERFNRQVYGFNDQFDRYVLKPAAKGYVAVVPHAFRLCIANGVSNVGEIRNAVNDILQAKPVGASTDTGRLAINTTLGVFGCFDVATKMGLERRTEDFGLTLARWGAGPGPYLMLPVLGPSDVRDADGSRESTIGSVDEIIRGSEIGLRGRDGVETHGGLNHDVAKSGENRAAQEAAARRYKPGAQTRSSAASG